MPNALLAKNYKKESSQKSETLFFHIRYFCKILFYLECNKQLAILIKLISWLLTQYPIAHLLSIDKLNKWIFICYSYIYIHIENNWRMINHIEMTSIFRLITAGNFCWARMELINTFCALDENSILLLLYVNWYLFNNMSFTHYHVVLGVLLHFGNACIMLRWKWI